MPGMPTYAEVMAGTVEDFDACFHARFNPNTDAYMAAEGIDYYEWYWWRFDPLYRWRLRNLIDPLANPGPYSTPVLCGLIATTYGIVMGTDESLVDYYRRAFCEINGLSEAS